MSEKGQHLPLRHAWSTGSSAPTPDARCSETEPIFTTGRAALCFFACTRILVNSFYTALRLASIENFQHRQKCLDTADSKRFDPQLDVIDAF